MIQEFKVVHDGNHVGGFTSYLSTVETERKFDVGVVELFNLEQSPRLEGLYWMVWRSLHPALDAADDAAFLAWLPGVESIAAVGDPLPPPLPSD